MLYEGSFQLNLKGFGGIKSDLYYKTYETCVINFATFGSNNYFNSMWHWIQIFSLGIFPILIGSNPKALGECGVYVGAFFLQFPPQWSNYIKVRTVHVMCSKEQCHAEKFPIFLV